VKCEDLLYKLADGEPRSGEELARHFGVTRAAIWKQMPKLRRWGIEVQATRGRGYCLKSPLDLLQRQHLIDSLSPGSRYALDRLDVFMQIESTNRYLLENPPTGSEALTVCLAEYQSAGRGRRGRAWVTPLAAGLCLSVGWQFDDGPEQLNGLTLAAGVSVKRVIGRICGAAIELKWPNDLVWDGAKLGGILVELTAETQGRCHVVIGVGLNVDVSTDRLATLSDWPNGAVDLRSISGNRRIDRHQLATALIDELGEMLADYLPNGFSPYVEEWRSADHLLGRNVVLSAENECLSGTAQGIADDAALLVKTADGRMHRIVSGDVSVRRAS